MYRKTEFAVMCHLVLWLAVQLYIHYRDSPLPRHPNLHQDFQEVIWSDWLLICLSFASLSRISIMNRRTSGFLLLFPSLLIVCRHSIASTSQASTATLKFVQILFRHGDRNPNRPWGPNDPNPESAWPQGWGQLTDLGKRQLYELGQQTKKRYQGFLSQEYK